MRLEIESMFENDENVSEKDIAMEFSKKDNDFKKISENLFQISTIRSKYNNGNRINLKEFEENQSKGQDSNKDAISMFDHWYHPINGEIEKTKKKIDKTQLDWSYSFADSYYENWKLSDSLEKIISMIIASEVDPSSNLKFSIIKNKNNGNKNYKDLLNSFADVTESPTTTRDIFSYKGFPSPPFHYKSPPKPK